MSTAQRFQPHLGQSPMQNLTFPHQVTDRTSDIFNRHIWIDAVLVEEIDSISVETCEHSLDSLLDMIGTAIESPNHLPCLKIDVPAKLGCDHNLVAEGFNGFAEQTFHLKRTISLSCVKKGDTM